MSSSDEIRRQLAAMRAVLRRDAHEAAADARTFADWRHHFYRHPWLCCAGAAVVGYLLVPRRQRSLEVDNSMFKKRALLQPAAMAASRSGESLQAKLLKAAASTAATALVRRSIALLVDQGRKHFDELRASRPGVYSEGARPRSMP